MPHYIWMLNVVPEKAPQFQEFSKKLASYNGKDMPEGCRFAAVYKTAIGLTDEPRYQVWFQFGNYADLDKCLHAGSVKKFHEDLREFVDLRRSYYSYILERLDEP